MTAASQPKSKRTNVCASAPVTRLLQDTARETDRNVSKLLLGAGNTSANQRLADRTRFELSNEKWLAFQTVLSQPASAKPRLMKLLSEPMRLG